MVCGCGEEAPEKDRDQKGKQPAASEDAGKTETAAIVTKAQASGVTTVSSIKYLESHNPAVRSLAVSPNKAMLASGDEQGKIILWSLPDLQKVKEIDLQGSLIHSVTKERHQKCSLHR